MHPDFRQRIEEIASKDPRYKADAYEFLMQALLFTQKKLKRQGHVTGRELLEGVRVWALKLYGPLARHVLRHWGVSKTEDFGRIVFNMVDSGLLGKRAEDSLSDFRDVYDLDKELDAFMVRKPGRKKARKEKSYENIS